MFWSAVEPYLQSTFNRLSGEHSGSAVPASSQADFGRKKERRSISSAWHVTCLHRIVMPNVDIHGKKPVIRLMVIRIRCIEVTSREEAEAAFLNYQKEHIGSPGKEMSGSPSHQKDHFGSSSKSSSGCPVKERAACDWTGAKVDAVYLTFLQNDEDFQDFEHIRKYSWGSAMLSLLIDNLKKEPIEPYLQSTFNRLSGEHSGSAVPASSQADFGRKKERRSISNAWHVTCLHRIVMPNVDIHGKKPVIRSMVIRIRCIEVTSREEAEAAFLNYQKEHIGSPGKEMSGSPSHQKDHFGSSSKSSSGCPVKERAAVLRLQEMSGSPSHQKEHFGSSSDSSSSCHGVYSVKQAIDERDRACKELAELKSKLRSLALGE
ncbi:hypothetical protein RHSIM_Rhsim05G0207600 [Rhododendron simsii]|uniref:Uncharacterized protein n=1 Tax=Rhododendron simsii TaxID=118357 RepID=A0A834LR54_RHOSS|nr:hypothetical protein RHSIM_Rhsim05G0207600 [Rhododendron simsii]